MFRRIANTAPDGAGRIFKLRPEQLSALLELAWKWRRNEGKESEAGIPYRRSNVDGLTIDLLSLLSQGADYDQKKWMEDNRKDFCGKVLWDHLIYAYMIENTRIYEIFRRVLREYFMGEKLGVPLPSAQNWLRNTEELFFREQPSFFISTVSSSVRSDLSATRRNAYWRMFGMDLNHGMDDGKAYPYPKADAYNREFINTFEEFLREVWVGISNADNATGQNPTDAGKILNLVQGLRNMLITRRINGNLSREEFTFVCMMSWFHLSVEFNSPIVESLQAQAASTEQRLFKIAERVGLPAHGLSKNLFDIASPISRILLLIEHGAFSDQGDENSVAKFYEKKDKKLTEISRDMSTIITHWSVITGRDVKSRKVSAA